MQGMIRVSIHLRKSHCASETRVNVLMARPLRPGHGSYPTLDRCDGAGITTIGGLALRASTWKPATRL